MELGRGAPALILLQYFYFGLPSVNLTLTSFWAAALAMAYCTAAYTSEIIRGGIESVAAGQTEAAEVIGLNRFDALRFVILPQALRVALPSLLGFSIMMFQPRRCVSPSPCQKLSAGHRPLAPPRSSTCRC